MEKNKRNLNEDVSDNAIELLGVLKHNFYNLNLLEIQEQNVELKNIVKQKTNKLNDVIANNIRFMSLIGHDLRSPFTSILGVLKLLKIGLENYDKDEFELLINVADKSVNSALNLTNNLLAWSLLQNDHQSFYPINIHFHDLIVEMIREINHFSIKKQISLYHTVPKDLCITADIQMIKAVLRNLIMNAIKFTEKNGEIIISAIDKKQFVEIEVSDNGIGMSKQVQENLFKFGVTKSMLGTNNEKGTGLGLLLCKEFIEIHCGKIYVESILEQGSKFKFQLPFSKI
ncbi:sensor histidine kinase [Chondrinema litorale]|uniref:sensor histidine kinase n=1 Tax=Chondrinema litorale TaxID=2994555 RepID=UPI002543C942|nr:HAMP domain-containing sensor histidine kinase [Chondrinema litorale]UZR99946.1 HAMP domain-containing sensor histidine kinase [Chondrinema litorale]